MSDTMNQTLQRLHIAQMRKNQLEADDDTPPVGNSGNNDSSSVPRVKKTKTPATNNTNNNDDNSDNSNDNDDADADKEFPATAAIAPLCKKIEDLGDQFYVVSELVKQVEGYKGENNQDAMQDALGALQSALSDMPAMQNSMKLDLAQYLKGYLSNG